MEEEELFTQVKLKLSCPFCYRLFDQSEMNKCDEVDYVADLDLSLQKQFIRLLSREEFTKMFGVLGMHNAKLGNILRPCSVCLPLIKSYCVYNREKEILEMKMNWKLELLKGVINGSEGLAFRMNPFKENLAKVVEENENCDLNAKEVVENVKRFRKRVVRQCSQKLKSTFPKCKISRCSIRKPVFSQRSGLKSEAEENLSSKKKKWRSDERSHASLQNGRNSHSTKSHQTIPVPNLAPLLDLKERIIAADTRANETEKIILKNFSKATQLNGKSLETGIIKNVKIEGTKDAKICVKLGDSTPPETVIMATATPSPSQHKKISKLSRNRPYRPSSQTPSKSNDEPFQKQQDRGKAIEDKENNENITEVPYSDPGNPGVIKNSSENDGWLVSLLGSVVGMEATKPKSYSTSGIIGPIVVDNKRIMCTVCKLVLWSGNFCRHYRRHHDLTGKDPSSVHYCRVENCNAFFLTFVQLHLHRINYHREIRMWSMSRTRCRNCGKTFSQNRYLRNHRRRSHMSDPSFKYVCEIEGCGKRFEAKMELKFHSRMHNQTEGRRMSEINDNFRNTQVV